MTRQRMDNQSESDRLWFTEDGFNLNLSYITQDIIAMCFPSPSIIHDVKRLLNHYHKNHYYVINLRLEEHENSYSPKEFQNRVLYRGFQDMTPPPFKLLLEIMLKIKQWLKKDSENVIVVHCLAGWGRTGTIISSYLLYSKAQPTAKDALKYFITMRGTEPICQSQQRWVHYMETYLSNGKDYHPVPMVIESIHLGTEDPSFEIEDGFVVKLIHGPDRTKSVIPVNAMEKDGEGILLTLKNPVEVDEDFKLDVRRRHSASSTEERETTSHLLHFWLNTGFLDASKKKITLSKGKIEIQEELPSDFKVTVGYTFEN